MSSLRRRGCSVTTPDRALTRTRATRRRSRTPSASAAGHPPRRMWSHAHSSATTCDTAVHGVFTLSPAPLGFSTKAACAAERGPYRLVVLTLGLANWKETPPLTAIAPSVHVSENVRLPPTYTDAMVETGCARYTLASCKLARGIPEVVATVSPRTDAEWATAAVSEVPAGAVHSRAAAPKYAPREKYPVDP